MCKVASSLATQFLENLFNGHGIEENATKLRLNQQCQKVIWGIAALVRRLFTRHGNSFTIAVILDQYSFQPVSELVQRFHVAFDWNRQTPF